MMRLEPTDLKPGDVLLYNSESVIGRLIRKFDDAPVSHAGLYLGNGEVGEALMVGHSGLHRNPLAESAAGCNWVEAARLQASGDSGPVLYTANAYLAQGDRYAYEQILMLAMILLTRKLDQSNPLVRWIAQRTFRGCARLLDSWRTQGREPMICSEFVFRAYDEALPPKHDKFSIEIIAQGTGQPRRLISRRRRLRIFGEAPITESPTVHPQSLLAKLAEAPESVNAAPVMPEQPKSAKEIAEEMEAEIAAAAHEYLGDMTQESADRAAYQASAEIAQEELEAAAAEFAAALIAADGVFAAPGPATGAGATSVSSMAIGQQLKQVVADFVTPGDLHRSPSLAIAGRLDLEGM